jgi:chromatin remodeling complex protein RSC6
MDTNEVGSNEVGSNEVGANEVGSNEVGANDMEFQFESIQQNLTKFKTNLSEIQQQLRTLEKSLKREQKVKPTKTTVVAMRQPKITGFDIPEKLTPELCYFMRLPEGSVSTRNVVSLYITEYIRQHKLQNMADRKLIELDKELALLFKLPRTEPITYFNIHKHMNQLFIRQLIA